MAGRQTKLELKTAPVRLRAGNYIFVITAWKSRRGWTVELHSLRKTVRASKVG